MTDYQLHVIGCIERFNRLHIRGEAGTGLPIALTEAMRRTNFDWWLVAPAMCLSSNYTTLPDNVTTFNPAQLVFEIGTGQMLMPRGLIIDGLLPRLPVGDNILTALVRGMKQVYGKNEMKIVTVGPTITLGHF
jgi:hypothetical protein